MDFEWLDAWLREHTDVDVDATRVEAAAETPQGYLSWLFDQGLIDTRTFRQAHAAQAVSTAFGVPKSDTWPGGDEPNGSPDGSPPGSPTSGRGFVKLGVVGQGAMAVIHVASETMLHRNVAYKVMKPNIAANPALSRRFLTEAQITAQLDHPNIVPVYAVSREGSGAPAYTMKLVDGTTLEELMDASAQARRAGDPPEDLALAAMLEHFVKVCDAVDYAHNKGVVHRDLKPANIMLGTHHEVYVMDWGIAKLVADDAGDTFDLDTEAAVTTSADGDPDLQTQAGMVVGTPAYMAPEQASTDAPVGPAADQYALGLILFEMLCCKPARPRRGGHQTLFLATQGHIEAFKPASTSERLPRELVAIIQRATQRASHERYDTVGHLAADVRRFLNNDPVRARPDTALQAVQRAISRNRERTFQLLIALVALLAMVFAAAVVKVAVDNHMAQVRAERLASRVADAGQIAAGIDEHFATVELRVHAIATAARNLLMYGQSSDVPYYRNRTFFAPDTRPPDMAPSKRWGKQLSTRWPNVHVAHDDWEPALEELAALAPIRREMREALLSPPLAEGPADRSWREHGGPVTYVDIGLQNGAVLELPGAGWEPGDYDPRERPWYEAGTTSEQATWGEPFPAMADGALLLPCSMAIRDDRGILMGVVSVQTSFDFLIAEHMTMDDDHVRETYILDDKGHILLRSTELEVREKAKALDSVHATPPYHHPEVLPLLGQPSGFMQLPEALIAWQKLHVRGWTVVVEADPI